MGDEILDQTLQALRRVIRKADIEARQLAAATGLTPSQFLVLQEIDRSNPATPTAIAGALSVSQATVTTILDRLESAGYAERRRGERDRRQFLLSVTGEGRSALDRAAGGLQQRFREGFAKLPAWEQAMMLAGIGRLAEMMEAEAAEPTLPAAGAVDWTG